MASKKVKISSKKKSTKATVKKINDTILKTSDAMLTVYVETGEKWHKLLSQTITMTEPLREKQIDMFFDTTDKVRAQVEDGAERFQNLLGIQEPISKIIKEQVTPGAILTALTDGATMIASKIKNVTPTFDGIKDAVKMKIEVTDDKFKKATKKKNKVKKSVKAKAKKASKSATKASKKTVKAIKKAAKTVTPKTIKVSTPKASVKKAKTVTKRKVKATTPKVAKTVKAVAKKTIKASTPKVKVAAKRATKATAGVKTTVKVSPAKKDNLKLIYGIGPKMEKLLATKGIKSFSVLSKLGVKTLDAIIVEGGPAYKSYKASHWLTQAKIAAKGDMTALKTWIDKNVAN